MERIAPLSKEVVKVWAGRSIVKYEVKEKRGPRLRENAGETWDDWAIERKWSWGRRRDEEEKWSQGRGEISGQGRGDVSGQGKAALVGSRDMVQSLESWATWARERKLSWGKKKVEETQSPRLALSGIGPRILHRHHLDMRMLRVATCDTCSTARPCRGEPSRHPGDEYPCSSACIGGEEDLRAL